MIYRNIIICISVLAFFLMIPDSICQTGVPSGINYQAVARDSYGKELASANIDVRFSIISQNPLGTIVYQELHSDVITSKYGVFSLIVGKGVQTGGIYSSLTEVQWADSFHYLKVEVKFDNSFTDMGTMQFMSVPYALFAYKSLDPGPEGPKGDTGPQGLAGLKGDPGDPASDDQTLSFDGTNLSITGGNTVNMSEINVPHQLSIVGDTLSIYKGNRVLLRNQIQDLSLDVNNVLKISNNPSATEIDLTRFLDDKQQLSFNAADSTLSITNGTNPIDLSIFNQSLSFNPSNNMLTISGGKTPVDLTILRDDADANPENEIQDLSYNIGTRQLSLSKSSMAAIDLSELKNDADASPTNEIQTLSYDPLTNIVSLNNGGGFANLGSPVTFRAEKNNPAGPSGESTMIFDVIKFNESAAYDNSSGKFITPSNGIYTFNVRYDAAVGAAISILINDQLYEKLAETISSSGPVHRSVTMKLVAEDEVKVVVNTGMSSQTGTGSFSGFRVY